MLRKSAISYKNAIEKLQYLSFLAKNAWGKKANMHKGRYNIGTTNLKKESKVKEWFEIHFDTKYLKHIDIEKKKHFTYNKCLLQGKEEKDLTSVQPTP